MLSAVSRYNEGGISWLLKNTFILLSIVFNGLLQWKKNHLNAKILHLFMW